MPSSSHRLICLEDKKSFLESEGEQAVIEASVALRFVVPRCESEVPHLFHRACLKSWLKKPGNFTCPICRSTVAGDSSPTVKPESQESKLSQQSQESGSTSQESGSTSQESSQQSQESSQVTQESSQQSQESSQ